MPLQPTNCADTGNLGWSRIAHGTMLQIELSCAQLNRQQCRIVEPICHTRRRKHSSRRYPGP
jgi:hypothetical protein